MQNKFVALKPSLHETNYVLKKNIVYDQLKNMYFALKSGPLL
jgi:hypothetical protein